MKKVVTLLTAIMLISLLASSSVMATSSSNRSRGVTIVQIIHYYIHAFYGHMIVSEERLPFDSVDDNDLVVGGDADDLAGGKIGRIGSEVRDPSAITLEGSSNLVTITD
jgi:hypothetical protein